ncbi:MAG: DUF3105 domain-containing protein [Chloroflexota bacterium]|nr:DUF3105 domain-containing protein [Chloroflexota bacterium]
MAKRRTSGIQRRSRASDEALSRRLGSGRGPALDWRLLSIAAILVLGTVILLIIFLFGRGGANGGGFAGEPQVDDGQTHIQEGTAGGGYSSLPATSGPHWNSADSPGPWGVYSNAQAQERLIHNLEHGGIVIWYQPSQLDAAGVTALTTYVTQQVSTAQFKVILTPWSGADFGHPIAVTAWNWLLYLDTANVDAVRTFLDAHYGDAPEPFGGPAQPGT